MARLNDCWLIQQQEGEVVLFDECTDEEIARWPAGDANLAAIAQGLIANTSKLTDEEKSFAHFWSGYFYAHAKGE